MNHNFPDRLTPIRQNSSSNTFYTFGPTGLNVPLRSGEYFTGYWAAWWSSLDGGIKYKQVPKFSFINNQEGGPSSPAFSGLYSPSIQRITNLSFTFDNSGSPVFALQDNGDQNIGFKSIPEIQVKTNDNRVALTFTGYYPIVFNNLEVNWPFVSPPQLTQAYQTGNVVLYYTDKNSTTLYSRFLSEGFATGHLVNSGLTPDFYNFSLRVAEVPSGDPYVPWQKIVYAFDRDKNLRVLAGRPGVNFAADNFERLPTGALNIDSTGNLVNGFGPWKRFGSIGDTLGYSTFLGLLEYDNFQTYPTGSGYYSLRGNFNYLPAFYSGAVTEIISGFDRYIDTYNAETGYIGRQDGLRGFQGLLVISNEPGRFKFSSSFIYDDFDFYQTGSVSNLNEVTGANFSYEPGRIFNTGRL